jgi:hypothetical protein
MSPEAENTPFVSSNRLRAREIDSGDTPAVVELLAKGFPRRSHEYWRRALERLRRHSTPPGLPKYGYVLDVDGAVVGVILLISSSVWTPEGFAARCNVSSWYVDDRFRSFATLLLSKAFRRKEITYINISPAKHVEPIIRAQGFVRYSDGQFVAAPALHPVSARSDVVASTAVIPKSDIEVYERDLLRAHEEYGCICFWCVTSSSVHPFIFLPRLVKGLLPCAQLIYAREISDVVRFASQIGRFLALKGRPLILVDSNGPIPNLVGKYVASRSPKYFRGPAGARLGDLTFTEAAMFGL